MRNNFLIVQYIYRFNHSTVTTQELSVEVSSVILFLSTEHLLSRRVGSLDFLDEENIKCSLNLNVKPCELQMQHIQCL